MGSEAQKKNINFIQINWWLVCGMHCLLSFVVNMYQVRRGEADRKGEIEKLMERDTDRVGEPGKDD